MVAGAIYIEANELRIYYQVHCEGEPLLHGVPPAEPCPMSAASTQPARP
jgi:hypothetical protein